MICVGGLYQTMSSDTIPLNQIKSPCIKICKIQNKKCIGCNRTIEEITQWSYYTDEQRETIINRVNE